jgi:hypothetical protein
MHPSISSASNRNGCNIFKKVAIATGVLVAGFATASFAQAQAPAASPASAPAAENRGKITMKFFSRLLPPKDNFSPEKAPATVQWCII